ncbi:hypothetical protein Pelo_8298 [Pelomyxa schiedti]|nr:hypothetical protein Pelo_8298 [Pelomyxa schiedti]
MIPFGLLGCALCTAGFVTSLLLQVSPPNSAEPSWCASRGWKCWLITWPVWTVAQIVYLCISSAAMGFSIQSIRKLHAGTLHIPLPVIDDDTSEKLTHKGCYCIQWGLASIAAAIALSMVAIDRGSMAIPVMSLTWGAVAPIISVGTVLPVIRSRATTPRTVIRVSASAVVCNISCALVILQSMILWLC